MTQEEIIQAISDDKMMSFIQPDQLAEIIDFVIKNYKPSLPSNLDEAAHEYAWSKQEHHIDFDGEEYFDYGPRYDAFKAGAKWMVEQMPYWKKCDKPFDLQDNTGINSENVIYRGYYIPWKELEKLPKID